MKQNGQSLIELLITIALSAILIPALLTGFFVTREGRAQQEQRLLATAYAKEAQEAVRIVARNGWNNLVNGTHHPIVSGSTWTFSSGSEAIGNLTRQIEIGDVQRDSNGEIVDSGGTLDPSTKEIIITVSWNSPLPTNVSSILYLSRFRNDAFIHTTQEDFEDGTLDGVIVTNDDGGEVTLGAGGGGNWCSPNLSIAALDLPKQGVANAISAIEGELFIGTGENASGVSLANVSVSNTYPPVASIIGTFDGYKTNDVFGEANYFYVATHRPNREIVIVDISSSPFSETGYYNPPPDIEDGAQGIYVVGNVGYAVVTNKLYTFDLSSKTGSRPSIDGDGVTLAGNGNKIAVIDNYAYVSISSTTTQLQIIDISNPANLTVVGSASVNGGAGQDVFVNSTGTRAYLATAASATQAEFFIIDIETKTGSRPVMGSYEASGMSPRGITVVTGNRAILVGTNGEEYQVINIVNEANPVRCGGLNIDTGVNGVASIIEADGDAYSYILTGDQNSELKIIEGGPGGQFSTSGEFTSSAFDASAEALFNRIITNFIQPFNTLIQFQIGVVDLISGTCESATYNFIGPDGTSNTFFVSSSAAPLLNNGQGYTNPGRCIKYKAFLSTNDPLSSPILNDFSVNYSP